MQWVKDGLFKLMVLSQLDIVWEKTQFLSFSHTIHKNQFQMDHRLKCKRQNTNASRRICKEISL